MRRAFAVALVCVAVASGAIARAELPVEGVGRSETLPVPHDPHWVWVADLIQRRSALVDVDDGRLLGMLDAGFGLPEPLFPRGPEIYMVETHYSRGARGERSDVLTIYDAARLAPLGEVLLPPKRAISVVPVGHAGLSDDDRFAAVFNLTPATSLSIVDLRQRRFVGEIETPGCSLVYPAGPRRFAALCMDGALLVVRVDDAGREASRWRSAPFFDPEADPVTEKAVRIGPRWLFVSFEGFVHAVDFAGDEPGFEERWSLLDDLDRAEGWRIGGFQHLAVHEATGRLYSLMHQGGPHTHKQSGTEVWVYDLATRRRIQRIELQHLGITYLGYPVDPGDASWAWIFHWAMNRVMRAVPDLGIDAIAVTQDDQPRLLTVGAFSGGLVHYDALTGEFLGRIFTGNMTSGVLRAPSGRSGQGGGAVTELDPVVQTALRTGAALLFVSSALHKLRGGPAFRAALAGYALLPAAFLPAAALALTAAELGVGVGVLVPRLAPHACLAGAGLLSLYAGAVALNLARGRSAIDCGCGGPGGRRPIGLGLVVRNGLLAGLLLGAAGGAAPRPWVWLDGATFAGLLASLVLLYAAVDVALANAARLRDLRSPA